MQFSTLFRFAFCFVSFRVVPHCSSCHFVPFLLGCIYSPEMVRLGEHTCSSIRYLLTDYVMFVLLHGKSVHRTIAMTGVCMCVCLFVYSCLLTLALRCPFRPSSITRSSLCAFVKTLAAMPSNDVVDENRTLRFIWPFTAGTLFASEIDDCLWICCFSCPFNQMALNDDRDLR